jgi:hypothetical protein
LSNVVDIDVNMFVEITTVGGDVLGIVDGDVLSGKM